MRWRTVCFARLLRLRASATAYGLAGNLGMLDEPAAPSRPLGSRDMRKTRRDARPFNLEPPAISSVRKWETPLTLHAHAMRRPPCPSWASGTIDANRSFRLSSSKPAALTPAKACRLPVTFPAHLFWSPAVVRSCFYKQMVSAREAPRPFSSAPHLRPLPYGVMGRTLCPLPP